MAPGRLLIVNPNSDQRVTAWLAAAAREAAGLTFEIEAINAASGLAALVTPEDVAHAAQAVVDAVDARPNADAVLIGAFGDPGLAELRRREPFRNVVGLGEAGLRAAAAKGRHFAIVTLGAAMEASIRVRLAKLGIDDQLTGVTILPVSIERFVAARAAHSEMLAAAVRQSFEQDRAEAVLLGGAPFAELASGPQMQSIGPVLDGVAAAVAALDIGRRTCIQDRR